MRTQTALTAVITAAVVRYLYGCRSVTFAVWTNAAMISRHRPLLTVTAIEAVVVALIAAVVWLLLDLAAYHLRDWFHLLHVIYGRGPKR
jgi:hypothetical protein